MSKETKNPNRVSDQIEQQLIQKIISLELPPGEMINETELAKQFECGRTPLREALQRLASENLVVNVPRRGTFIAELKLLDFFLLTETEGVLGKGMAALAAQKATDAEFERLKEILEESKKAWQEHDHFKVTTLDLAFHETIAACTKNSYLIDVTVHLHRLIGRFLFLALTRGMEFTPYLQAHIKIYEALKNREADLAGLLLFDHLVDNDHMMLSL
jgi:DNA-binding GntR family transcriptional regulator